MKEIKEVIVKEVRSVNRYMIVAGTTEKPEEYAIIEYIPLTNCCDATIKESTNHKREYTMLLPTITQQGISMGEVVITDATSLADAISKMTATISRHAETMEKIINQAKLALPPSASMNKPKLVHP